MNKGDLDFLGDLGINVCKFNSMSRPGSINEVVTAEITINMDQFGLMRKHFYFISAVAESTNPQVREMYGQLVSLALLTENKK